MAVAGTMDFDFEDLTRRHGVKVQCSLSVEECSLAIGDVVGHEHIKSASRMNNAIVVFLGTVEKAREIIASGIVINDTLTPVLPLSTPATKVIISNAPPFISDDMIESNLLRYGRVVSSMRKINLGCKSPLLKHVVSFRRQVYMVLDNNGEDLDLTMKLKVGGFEYTVYATSDSVLRCFFCHMSGHVVRDCVRKKQSEAQPPERLAEQTEGGTSAAGSSVTNIPPASSTESAPVPSHEPHTPAPSNGSPSAAPNDPRSPNEAGSDAARSEAELVNLSAEEGTAEAAESSPPLAEPTMDDAAVNNMVTKELAVLSETITHSGHDDTDNFGSQPEMGEVVEMEAEGGFKAPKRKETDSADCTPSKAKKVGAASAPGDSDNESVCSSMSDVSLGDLGLSGGERAVLYKVEDISRFLDETKGQRCVEVEHYFPDRRQFINDAARLIREQAFTTKETARLRKHLTKLRKKVREEAPLSH